MLSVPASHGSSGYLITPGVSFFGFAVALVLAFGLCYPVALFLPKGTIDTAEQGTVSGCLHYPNPPSLPPRGYLEVKAIYRFVTSDPAQESVKILG